MSKNYKSKNKEVAVSEVDSISKKEQYDLEKKKKMALKNKQEKKSNKKKSNKKKSQTNLGARIFAIIMLILMISSVLVSILAYVV